MKRKNLITITKHPSVSCYVEEGTRKGNLGGFVGDLLDGGAQARKLLSIGSAGFYVHYCDKPMEEKDLWITRLRNIRLFAVENLS